MENHKDFDDKLFEKRQSEREKLYQLNETLKPQNAGWAVGEDNQPSALLPPLSEDPRYTKPPTADDPWQHRAEHMRCRSCMWYVEKLSNIGRCRRHAPTMNGYPVVYETDWCGDHKLNEKA